ncbi:MAG: hypothetical protein PHH49_08355, partial [Candidatus Omnitrophica bacterium]|nr:hypothetical protein [Candidatus Omnitrophota bacterium]
PLAAIDQQVITTSSFDDRGNALEQDILRYYYEDASFMFGEAQHITNAGHDIHDRAASSAITSYSDAGLTAVTGRQEIDYLSYDRYGNALSQRIRKYTVDEATGEATVYAGYSEITNVYGDPVAQRRGNATETTAITYNSGDVKTGRTVTISSNFTSTGHAQNQTITAYVMDGAAEKLTKVTDIVNENINNRGDAGTQRITVSQTDADGLNPEVISYQVLTNRDHDAQHNVINQEIFTYTEEGGTLLDVQEIRNSSYHSSGVAIQQRIATYSNIGKTELLDVKTIVNENIDADGNVGTTTITKYASRLGTDVMAGAINPDPLAAIDKQVITTSSFDDRGNALEQNILKYYYESGSFVFGEAQHVRNSGHDIHDRTANSTITTYSDESMATVTSRQDIEYLSYDRYGNALSQRIMKYTVDEATGEATVYSGYSEITNVYGDPAAQRRGNATLTTVVTYSSSDIKTGRTVTESSNFTSAGHAQNQTITAYVMDGAVEKLTKVTDIVNENINNRGDVGTQRITVSQTDADGLDPEVISYQVLTNRSYDAQHNVINQEIFTYTEESGTLLDVQEIRNSSYHSSGVAMQQTIATYSNTAKTELLDVKTIVNENIDADGNVGTTTITKYSARLGTDVMAGAINLDPLAAIDKQVITTSSFDSRGNALEQDILKYYYESGSFVFGEAQHIVNAGHDIHDRTANSTITTYSDESMATVTSRQDIEYLSYDRYGNALSQRIMKYTVDEATGEATVYAGKSEITNVYGDPAAQRRGNATETITIAYNSSDIKTGRTVTVSSNFTSAGHAQNQTITAYVMDGAVEKLAKVTDIVNENINNRGDAETQKITLRQTDADGLNPEVVSYQVLTNRNYDAQHNILNQEIFTYTEEAGTLLDVQEIRNSGYHSSGAVMQQVIATYSNADKTALLDVKTITNDNIDVNGNAGQTTITKYSARLGTDLMTGAINPDPETAIDKQVITTSSFDDRGNSLEQDILKYYYDDGAFKFSEAQHIVSAGHDIHDRAANSAITSYRDETMSTATSRQNIEYLSYDRYGNALSQKVSKYTVDEATGEPTVYAGYNEITNVYGNGVAQRRGNATQTTSITYNSSDIKTGRAVTESSNFTTAGHAKNQTITTYVMDGAVEKLTKITTIVNENINNRGDAETQKITIKQTDEDGLNIEAISYQVLTNRSYDAQHNILNQEIFTYTAEGGTLLDVQEIRNSGYHSSGAVLAQVIATYSDKNKTDLLDLKTIVNDDIDVNGNVGKTTITKYSSRLGTDVMAGVINPDPATAIDKQVITTSSFDDRGNSLEQDILKYYYDDGAFKFSEAQHIASTGHDIHDRATNSVITSFNEEAMTSVTGRQDIAYLSYDRYGNALSQKVSKYTVDEATGEATVYAGYNEITNVYGDVVAQKRGNTTQTTTVTYNSSDVKTGRTVTVSSNFTSAGYAQEQTITSHIMDGATEKLTKITMIINENINNRGDAETQKITVSQTDSSGLNAEVVSYQVLTNRSYDAQHNILNQEIFTYTEEAGTLLDVQEIRNSGYHSSGVAMQQTIATYSDANKTHLLDVKTIVNENIDADGNVGTSTITKYSARIGSDIMIGTINPDPLAAIDKQVITTSSSDDRGNALEQDILKYYYDNGTFKFSEAQHIVNAGHDIHDRAATSIITSYDDETMTSVTGSQQIEFLSYDRYGNALSQKVSKYAVDEATGEATIYTGYSEITNVYGDAIAERRGNATQTTTVTYNSSDVKTGRTVTVSSNFTAIGYAKDQTITSYAMDGAVEKLTKITTIVNEDINNRGDAGTQKITVSQTDADGLNPEVVSYQVLTNRSYDAQHNILNQVIFTYTAEGGTLLDVQEIRNSSYHSSGVACGQTIATYSDTGRTQLLDVKTIVNGDIDADGNVGTSTITKYSARLGTDQMAGEVNPDPATAIDKQVITTSSFDERGNSLEQDILKYYYDDGTFKFSEAQHIVNAGHDIHDRGASSVVTSYSDEAMTTVTGSQHIEYLSYDRYGNALSQKVSKYAVDEATGEATIYTGYSEITNVYGDAIAERRGNATQTTTVTYNSSDVKTGRTVTVSSNFISAGYAKNQTITSYVMDGATERLTKITTILNENINNRGDAGTQKITVSQTDSNGLNPEVVSYQVLTNRSYDAQHNILNQVIFTYTAEGGTLLDVQEIRNSSYHSSGVATQQTIATYSDTGRTQLLDVKTIVNGDIDADGNVGTSTITKYSARLGTDQMAGEINPDPATAIDKQVITTSSFDDRGNALEQDILKYYYDDGAFKFSEAQHIASTGHDIHDRAATSVITSYSDVAMTTQTGKQDITFSSYDRYGNVLTQVVRKYAVDEATGEATLYAGKNEITNVYGDPIAERRGNATQTTTVTYNSSDVKTGRTVTVSSNFTAIGYAKDQTITSYAMDGAVEKLTKITTIVNEDINNRGDAGTQKITVSQTDADGLNPEVVSYQVLTNRSYDAQHNILNQVIFTYTAEGGTLLDVQEIRNSSYHSSGVACGQTIATYSDTGRTQLLDVKTIVNGDINTDGNVGTSTITKYSARLGTDQVTGAINPDPATAIDKQVITTSSFDDRGNALEQDILKYYYDDGTFKFSEAQHIVNAGHDIRDRAASSIVTSYSDEAMTSVTGSQVIEYLSYDRYGNALSQKVSKYAVDEATGKATVYTGYSEITNVYGDPIAERRGNATQTTTVTYNSSDVKTGRTVTVSSNFTAIGYAQDQTITSYVMDGATERLTKITTIVNENINNRGDAGTQRITVSQTDSNGLNPEVVSYQVLTNRSYDAQHNIRNQEIFTYTAEGGTLLDVQEIRNSSYHSSGVATQQRIATYSDAGKTSLLDVKVVVNGDINTDGNVGTSTITKYSARLGTDQMAGEINPDPATAIDKQVITTSSFDEQGNALEQDILKYYYDNGTFKFSEAQHIVNAGHDIHDRVASSVVTSYSDEAMTSVTGSQVIEYLSYDRYGNALRQKISKYAVDEGTGKATVYTGYSEITNVYGDAIAERRGNATQTTTVTYNSSDVKTGRTVTVSSN